MNQKRRNNHENINYLSVIDFAVFLDFEETTSNRFTFEKVTHKFWSLLVASNTFVTSDLGTTRKVESIALDAPSNHHSVIYQFSNVTATASFHMEFTVWFVLNFSNFSLFIHFFTVFSSFLFFSFWCLYFISLLFLFFPIFSAFRSFPFFLWLKVKSFAFIFIKWKML